MQINQINTGFWTHFQHFSTIGCGFTSKISACTAPITGPAGPAPAVREDGAARGFYSELDPEKLMVKTLGGRNPILLVGLIEHLER